MFDRLVLLALTPLTLAGGAISWSQTDTSSPATMSSHGGDGSSISVSMTAGRPMTLHRAPDGLFHAPVDVNGTRLMMIVDTGATRSIISARSVALARRSPVAATGTGGTLRTLNGETRYRETAPLGVSIGSRRIHAIKLIVVDQSPDLSVIGQDVLHRLGPVTLDGDRMLLP